MSKVLIIFPPFYEGKTSEYGMPPLGPVYLGTFLAQKGIQTDVVDAQMEGLSLKQITDRVKAENPDILGFSVMTQMLPYVKSLVDSIKQSNPRIRIVLGGCHINSTEEEIFQYINNADFLVHGEGEHTLFELVQSIELNKSLKNIDGLIYKENGGIIKNNPRPFLKNLDELPFPDLELIQNFSIKRCNVPFADRSPMISMMASRGCPYRCSFCDVHKANGKKIRLRSVENMVEEILVNKKKYGINYVIFKDSTFTLRKSWVTDFCNTLIKKNISIHWRGNSRVDLIDYETLKLMKKAGCHNISLGVESGSQRILDLLKKDVTIPQIKAALRMLNDVGIETHISFIVGSPTETLDEVMESIKLAKEINPTYAQFGKGIAYPGTMFFEQAIKYKCLQDPLWYLKIKKIDIDNYFIDPSFGGEIQTSFDSEKIIKEAHRKFFIRPAYVLTTLKKLMKNPGYFTALFKSALAMIAWMLRK